MRLRPVLDDFTHNVNAGSRYQSAEFIEWIATILASFPDHHGHQDCSASLDVELFTLWVSQLIPRRKWKKNEQLKKNGQ